MAINLARVGAIQRKELPDYNPFEEGRARAQADMALMQEARNAKRAAFDEQVGALNLANLQKQQIKETTADKENADTKAAMGQYLDARNAAQTLPVGVVNATSLAKPEIGPQPENYQIPRDTSTVEREATMNLAKINPMTAETFRKGVQTERETAEDRDRKIAKEKTDAETAIRKEKYDAETAARKEKSEEAYRAATLALQRQTLDLKLKELKFKSEGGNLKPVPAKANTDMLENIKNSKKALTALALINGKTVGSLVGEKNTTGKGRAFASLAMAGLLPGVNTSEAANILQPSGAATRAVIADLKSMKIHERSGAATPVTEFKQLAGFLPTEFDNDKTVKTKLISFIQEYNQIVADQALQYGPDQGYRPSAAVSKYLNEMPTAFFDNREEYLAAKKANTINPGQIVNINGEDFRAD